MKSKLEAGFTAVETIAVIVLVAVIGLVAWYVHVRPAKTSDLFKISHGKTFTDAAGIYQLTYPSNWKVIMGHKDDDMGTSTDPSFPTFIPNDATKPPCDALNCISTGNGFDVASYKQSNPSNVFKDGWLPLKKETINGYTAYSKTLNYNLTLVNVFVVHNGYFLNFSFVEKSSGGIGASSFDDSRHLAAFNDLVHTIKFLR